MLGSVSLSSACNAVLSVRWFEWEVQAAKVHEPPPHHKQCSWSNLLFYFNATSSGLIKVYWILLILRPWLNVLVCYCYFSPRSCAVWLKTSMQHEHFALLGGYFLSCRETEKRPSGKACKVQSPVTIQWLITVWNKYISVTLVVAQSCIWGKKLNK